MLGFVFEEDYENQSYFTNDCKDRQSDYSLL